MHSPYSYLYSLFVTTWYRYVDRPRFSLTALLDVMKVRNVTMYTRTSMYCFTNNHISRNYLHMCVNREAQVRTIFPLRTRKTTLEWVKLYGSTISRVVGCSAGSATASAAIVTAAVVARTMATVEVAVVVVKAAVAIVIPRIMATAHLTHHHRLSGSIIGAALWITRKLPWFALRMSGCCTNDLGAAFAWNTRCVYYFKKATNFFVVIVVVNSFSFVLSLLFYLCLFTGRNRPWCWRIGCQRSDAKAERRSGEFYLMFVIRLLILTSSKMAQTWWSVCLIFLFFVSVIFIPVFCQWQENASQEKLIAQTRARAKIKAEQRGQYGGAITPRARSADGGEERGQIKVIK